MLSSLKYLEIVHLTHMGSQGSFQAMILNNLSYRFKQGNSYALTGSSGAGKSTLIHLLTGLETPTRGQVFFAGRDIYALSGDERALLLQKELGIIFQVPYLIDELTVIENVMLKGLIAEEDAQQAHEKALALLKKVGLQDKEGQRPRSLSGGEQQRVAIARALYSQPSWIVADEPTAHLDRATEWAIGDLLLSYQQETRAGLIVASHAAHLVNSLETVLELTEGSLRELSPALIRTDDYRSKELS